MIEIKKNIVLVFILLGFSCNSSENQRQILGFDFNKEETVFAYSVIENGRHSIIIMDKIRDRKNIIDELDFEVLSMSLVESGDSLFYIREDTRNHIYEIVLYDNISNNKIVLYSDSNSITELVYINNTLIFLSANTINSYSPISTVRPHGFDLYKFEIGKANIERLTNESAYSMNNLEAIDSMSVSFILDHTNIANVNLYQDSLYKINVKELIKDEFFFLSRFDICKKEKITILYSNYKFYSSNFGNIPQQQEGFRVNSHIKQMKFSEKNCILYFLLYNPNDRIYKYSVDDKKVIGSFNYEN